MTDVLRQCRICLKEFPYTQMEKELKKEWGKHVYYCKPCIENPPINKSIESKPEEIREVSFAEKYQNVAHKMNWWD